MKPTECKTTIFDTGEPLTPSKAAALAAFLAELAAKADPEKVRQYAEKKREERTA